MQKNQTQQLAELSAAVANLTRQVCELKGNRPQEARRPRRVQQGISAPSPVEVPLFSKLVNMFQAWKGPKPRTDAQLRKALQGVLAAHLLLTPTRRRLQSLMPARLVKSADKALTTKVFSAPSLDAAAWMAPVH